MIEEEAAVKCGGVAGLLNAVKMQRVKKTVHNGIEMYMFPRIQIGRREEHGMNKHTSRNKAITNSSYKVLSDSMAELGWVVKPMKELLDQEAATGTLPEDLQTKLIKCDGKFSQCLRACQKTFKEFEAVTKKGFASPLVYLNNNEKSQKYNLEIFRFGKPLIQT